MPSGKNLNIRQTQIYNFSVQENNSNINQIFILYCENTKPLICSSERGKEIFSTLDIPELTWDVTQVVLAQEGTEKTF